MLVTRPRSTLTNLSPDAAFADGSSAATRLLTGFGAQFGVNITGGTVTVGGTPVNFDGGQSTSNISNQYGYANQPVAFYNQPVTLPVDNVVTSVQTGGLSKFDPTAGSLGGPDYGSLSASETLFGSGQAAVRGSIVFYLTFDGAAPTFEQVNAGNVVLAFGSPTATGSSVPDQGSTIALFALGLSGLIFARSASDSELIAALRTVAEAAHAGDSPRRVWAKDSPGACPRRLLAGR